MGCNLMATDARISTGLPSHPKTKKLVRRLGPGAGWGLVCLFLWVASNRSDGDLSGMSTEDIELAADWDGHDGVFVKELCAVRFLDGTEGCYSIHDWAEHNPWAAGAESRSLKAKWNAAKRHHGPAEADRLVPEYAAIRNASSTDAAEDQQIESVPPLESSTAPSPYPSPYPTPTLNTEPTVLVDTPAANRPPACPNAEIVDLYHQRLPTLPRVDVLSDGRKRTIAARWKDVLNDPDIKKSPTPRDAALEFFDWFFDHASKSRFLTGRVKDWRADLDFLMTPSKFVKVIEGHYHKEHA